MTWIHTWFPCVLIPRDAACTDSRALTLDSVLPDSRAAPRLATGSHDQLRMENGPSGRRRIVYPLQNTPSVPNQSLPRAGRWKMRALLAQGPGGGGSSLARQHLAFFPARQFGRPPSRGRKSRARRTTHARAHRPRMPRRHPPGAQDAACPASVALPCVCACYTPVTRRPPCKRLVAVDVGVNGWSMCCPCSLRAALRERLRVQPPAPHAATSLGRGLSSWTPWSLRVPSDSRDRRCFAGPNAAARGCFARSAPWRRLAALRCKVLPSTRQRPVVSSLLCSAVPSAELLALCSGSHVVPTPRLVYPSVCLDIPPRLNRRRCRSTCCQGTPVKGCRVSWRARRSEHGRASVRNSRNAPCSSQCMLRVVVSRRPYALQFAASCTASRRTQARVQCAAQACSTAADVYPTGALTLAASP